MLRPAVLGALACAVGVQGRAAWLPRQEAALDVLAPTKSVGTAESPKQAARATSSSRVSPAAPQKKCVDAAGEPVWCTSAASVGTLSDAAINASRGSLYRTAPQTGPEKKCVDAAGEPVWCTSSSSVGPRIAQFVDPKAVKNATSQAASDPMVCGVLYFVHIPKTGGTTINDRLRGLGWAFNRLYWGDEEEGDDPNAWLKDQDAWKKSDGWQWLLQMIDSEEHPKIVLEAHHGAPGLEYMVEHELKEVACKLKERGCQVRVVTMMRKPVDRIISSLIFNNEEGQVFPEDDVALGELRYLAEEQPRYLLSGHHDTWPKYWLKYPDKNSIDWDLVRRVQHALSYAAIVGNTRQLDEFVAQVYNLLGVEPERDCEGTIVMHKWRSAEECRRRARVQPDLNVQKNDYIWSELSDNVKQAVLKVTQTDRNIYHSWFRDDDARPRWRPRADSDRSAYPTMPQPFRDLADDC